MTGRSLDKVNGAKAEIEAAGVKGKLSTFQLDITDDESIARAVKYVEEHHGHLDCLINNAATNATEADLKTRLRKCLETNVVGVAVIADQFRPLLLKSSNPYSIFIGSLVGTMAITESRAFIMTHDDAYSTSKAALNMFMVLEHRDYGWKGLKVFGVCPGFVVSNIRGTSEEERNPGGQAGDPMVSGQTILSVIQGKRDAEVGKLIHKDGVYDW